ncbi:DNA adenine methylase [Nodularia spumigena]|jgi:DNA adenine methylase|uniref:DNA adenine methylase n=1 Tax=Nodularia spumigena TaxID=70799 RepID=UPI00232D344E|nr:DNA adenine methylase [Nodularia spumigena]MDB9498560.1 DNA adenine methylase [Nodularia spumigena CS-336/02]
MKTPITYYGGKQKMVGHILPLIPAHNLYCEPFCGGAAVFFTKPPSNIEVINDTNRELINFYWVVQNEFYSLEKLVKTTLHSRSLFNDAKVIYENPHMFDQVKRAWAVWVIAAMGFSSKLDGSFGYDKSKNTTTMKINNKRTAFTEEIAQRLQGVQIECTDALRIIRSRDNQSAFFYLDPPYFNSDMGHYDGYTREDFEALLQELSKIEGKFLLSSYHSPLLQKYVKANGWYQKRFVQGISVNKGYSSRTKTEYLSANYPL